MKWLFMHLSASLKIVNICKYSKYQSRYNIWYDSLEIVQKISTWSKTFIIINILHSLYSLRNEKRNFCLTKQCLYIRNVRKLFLKTFLVSNYILKNFILPTEICNHITIIKFHVFIVCVTKWSVNSPISILYKLH